MHRALIAIALCPLLLAVACEGDAASTAPNAPASEQVATYVGQLDDSDVRVAIVRAGSSFEAYVCGRGDQLATHTHWFAHGEDGGPPEAVIDGWRLSLSVHTDGMQSGELETPEGKVLTWSATRARAGTEEGLYEASHAGCRAGIIVWKAEAGAGCKAQGSWCDAQGQRGQVTPVVCAPDEPLEVQAIEDGATFELIGERVVLP